MLVINGSRRTLLDSANRGRFHHVRCASKACCNTASTCITATCGMYHVFMMHDGSVHQVQVTTDHVRQARPKAARSRSGCVVMMKNVYIVCMYSTATYYKAALQQVTLRKRQLCYSRAQKTSMHSRNHCDGRARCYLYRPVITIRSVQKEKERVY